jgi:hypothetical protein
LGCDERHKKTLFGGPRFCRALGGRGAQGARLGSLMSETLGELALLIRAFVACGEAADAAALQAERMERGPGLAVK